MPQGAFLVQRHRLIAEWFEGRLAEEAVRGLLVVDPLRISGWHDLCGSVGLEAAKWVSHARPSAEFGYCQIRAGQRAIGLCRLNLVLDQPSRSLLGGKPSGSG